jgi:hypothetical protein
MNAANQLREDLSFVAQAVKRGTEAPGVPAILLLWAVLIPVGFSLADFAPQRVGWYWVIAGPLGGIISGVLGHLGAKSSGFIDKSLGRRHGWHWLTMFAAYGLLGASIATGRMNGLEVAPIWLLITAVVYTTGGIHLSDSRGMLPAGVIMFLGYAALEWLPLPYPWTVTGLIVSVSLVVAATGRARLPAVA